MVLGNDHRLGISVVDRFIILRLREDKSLLPEGIMMESIADTLSYFSDKYSIICDWRGLKHQTDDVLDLVEYLCLHNDATILATPADIAWIKYEHRRLENFLPVSENFQGFNFTNFPLKAFDETNEECWDFATSRFGGSITDYRISVIDSIINEIATNSLLVQYSIQERQGDIFLTPYHANAVYNIDISNDIIISQPGVIAQRTYSVLKSEISEFERIINTPAVKESTIQSFFEKHPNFLRNINSGYKNIYPQIVLERNDGTSLRPDFILEPFESHWCDILDIKRPNMPLIVGTKDRLRFSYAVQELIAQLREYSAYFEDPDLYKKVEKRLGIKCYRPRLIGVVGSSLNSIDDRQLRRIQTQYMDVKLLTFSDLLKIAEKRILI